MNLNKYRFLKKEHSIEKVHDIWIKAKERSLIRRNRFSNFIKTIPNHVQPDHNKNYVIYYNINETVNSIILNFNGRFGSWSFHKEHLNMDKTRDKILSYWISDDSITELGNKFRELEDDRGFVLEGRSRKILDDKINTHFREYFNKLKKLPPESFITIIGDKKYIVTTKDRHDYATFTLSTEVEEPIKINESISKSEGYIESRTDEYLQKVANKNFVLADVSGQVCPLCYGRGEYHIGGSFGGNVQIVRCDCGQTLR